VSTLTLGLLLHIYQPPSQTPDVLARIVDESYRPLLRTFRVRSGLRASVNINAVTTEMLIDHGYGDVVQAIRDLAETGQIELTGSGKYHPILPLIPPEEASRQIALNAESHARLFGDAYRPRGFFPPEMAFAPPVASPIAAAGHDWMLLGGIASTASTWPLERVHRVESEQSFSVLFRDDILSNIISFRSTDVPDFIGKLRALTSPRMARYVVIAMDGETYGHHIPGWEEEFLGRLYDAIASPAPTGRSRAARGQDASFIHPATLSEIVDRFPAGAPLTPRASSWSTTQWDLDNHDPFPLWNHPGNEIQDLLWRHLHHALALFNEARGLAPEAEETRIARVALDRAEHSDQFWWASRRPHWSPALVQRGLNIQREAMLHAARAVFHSAASGREKQRAEDRLASAHSLAARTELLLARG
jgi:alpha-amylase/alpha-mannosidase (GH57 family)